MQFINFQSEIPMQVIQGYTFQFTHSSFNKIIPQTSYKNFYRSTTMETAPATMAASEVHYNVY